MLKVTQIQYDGTAHDVFVPEGLSVMRGAVDNAVLGIDADCGRRVRLRELPCVCLSRNG